MSEEKILEAHVIVEAGEPNSPGTAGGRSPASSSGALAAGTPHRARGDSTTAVAYD